MDNDEYLSRLQAAYFHVQALAEALGQPRQSMLMQAGDLLAMVYMHAADALGTQPWEIKAWTGPANRSWERP